MKLSHLKSIIAATLFLLGTMLYQPTETTAFEIIDSKVSGTVKIHVSARFQTAGFIEVEHERLFVPQMDKEFWKNNSFIKNAKISVHGETGEVINVSCAVVDNSKKISNRDCDGSHLKHKEILSGDSIKTGVAITSDMINKKGKANKVVFMQVSYI